MTKAPVEVEWKRSNRFGFLDLSTCWWSSILGILVCLLTTGGAAAQPQAKNVLILNSSSDRGNYDNLNFLKSALRSRISWPIDFYVAYLEVKRLDNKEYAEELGATLRNMYAGVHLDLVIAQGNPALQFAAKQRDELFPGVPIVFTMVDSGSLAGQKIWP